jgi:hypothetical protein
LPLLTPFDRPAPNSIFGDERCADQVRTVPRNRGKRDFWQVSLSGSPEPMMPRKNTCQKVIKTDEMKKKKRGKKAKKKQV